MVQPNRCRADWVEVFPNHGSELARGWNLLQHIISFETLASWITAIRVVVRHEPAPAVSRFTRTQGRGSRSCARRRLSHESHDAATSARIPIVTLRLLPVARCEWMPSLAPRRVEREQAPIRLQVQASRTFGTISGAAVNPGLTVTPNWIRTSPDRFAASAFCQFGERPLSQKRRGARCQGATTLLQVSAILIALRFLLLRTSSHDES